MERKSNRLFRLVLTLAMAAILTFVMAGCGEGTQEAVQPEEQVDYEVALITDDSLIMDGGHSEAAWNAITEFCATHGISHKYYKATEATAKAYKDVVDTAIDKGAKVIIADGYALSKVAYDSKDEYKDTKFLLLNMKPVDQETGDVLLSDQTVAVTFDSTQAGYLAGYMAVLDGYTKLGFVGEKKNEEISGYGYGFIKGANRAAKELNVEVMMHYRYCKANESSDSIMNSATRWYNAGTEVIMACGADMDTDIIRAAEATSGKVIGCISDKSDVSDTVITSAVINVDQAIEDMLEAYTNDEFPGGNLIPYNASNNGVSLALKTNGFVNVTQKEYDEIYDKLASGKIKINTENVKTTDDLKVTNITYGEPKLK